MSAIKQKVGIRTRIYNAFSAMRGNLVQPEKQAVMRGGNHHYRGYQAAAYDRLSKDWRFSDTTGDVELHQALRIMRNRSRDLARNDDYFKRFLNLLKTNVIGYEGVRLRANYKRGNGDFDIKSIEKVERAWMRWSKKYFASSSKKQSLWKIACQVAHNWAVDGEAIIQMLPGFNNDFGFALKVLSADQLDADRNEVLQNGNTIVMGVEKNSDGEPVAYHILTRRPGDTINPRMGLQSMRVPASEIIHFYREDDPGQTRGEPLAVTAMKRLRHLGAYEEAELVASRIAASKMGFFKSNEGGEFGDDIVDEDGNPIEHSKEFISSAEPGTFEVLPDNYDFVPWDPQHPKTGMDAFCKHMLRGVASGLNVSYVGLSNNLEGVSYSSIRTGEMSDRDAWRMIQRFFIEDFYEDIFRAWLPYAIISGQLDLPLAQMGKWLAVKWRPRGWKWIDPQKEVNAKVASISNCLESIYDVASEAGEDADENIEDNARAKAFAESKGLSLPIFTENQPVSAPAEPATEEEDAEDGR